MELNDITDPRALNLIETCYREVEEETGIAKTAISDLKLRYITIRKTEGEIRLHHHFFGKVETEFALPKCTEGELHWVDKEYISELPMTTSVGEAVRHWLANLSSDVVYMVVVNTDGDTAIITEI